MKALLFIALIFASSCIVEDESPLPIETQTEIEYLDDTEEFMDIPEDEPHEDVDIDDEPLSDDIDEELETEIEIIDDDAEVDDIDYSFEIPDEEFPEERNPVFPLTSTSTGAKYYKDFTKSPAYKKYTKFAKLYQSKYTSIMPGVTSTDINGKTCKTMVPQGICIAKDYLLISAYDSNGKYKSVLYVMSNSEPSNRKYVMTLVLPISGHVGGIAFDGSYVWVANGKSVSSIKYSTLKSKVTSAVSAKKSSVSISFSTTCSVLTQASFMTYYDNLLWVGLFKEKGQGDGNMYGYKISSDRKKLTKKYRMTVPDRTQGACFKDGYLFLSRSYSRNVGSSTYISQMRIYKPSFSKPTSAGLIYKNDAKKTITLPPMSEGIVAGSTYVYNIFESCATKYKSCKYPVDRIVAYKFDALIK